MHLLCICCYADVTISFTGIIVNPPNLSVSISTVPEALDETVKKMAEKGINKQY